MEPFASFSGKLEQRDFSDIDAGGVVNYPTVGRGSGLAAPWCLNEQVPFINDVTGILMLNTKTALAALVPPAHLPHTPVSHSFTEPWAAYLSAPDTTWLVTPPAGDAGADVYLLEPGSSNNRVVPQSMTGNTASPISSPKGA
ncbi:hypothetical protein [Streptomyces sp. NPDC059008]|uniref:hypothetical protein n=1 Tax=Streptomyces sp. NPDC059008 TaxID=3346693 RepID=UPI0036C95032